MVPAAWVRQHVIGHHSFTNMATKDPDLYHYKPLFTSHPSEKLKAKPMFSSGPLFCSFWGLAPLLTQWVPLLHETFTNLLLTNRITKCIEKEAVWAAREKLLTWVTWAGLMLGLVTVVNRHGFQHAFTPLFTVSIMYYLFSQVSHINAASFCPTPLSSLPLTEWSRMQVMASQGDYNYRKDLETLHNVVLVSHTHTTHTHT